MTITSTRPQLTWTPVSETLSSGAWDGNYAGMIELVDGRYIATDAYGALAGRFATEEQARSALHPDALEAAWNAREKRERIIASVTAVVAGGSALVAAFGFVTMAGLGA